MRLKDLEKVTELEREMRGLREVRAGKFEPVTWLKHPGVLKIFRKAAVDGLKLLQKELDDLGVAVEKSDV